MYIYIKCLLNEKAKTCFQNKTLVLPENSRAPSNVQRLMRTGGRKYVLSFCLFVWSVFYKSE